jgi:hypothetical protein
LSNFIASIEKFVKKCEEKKDQVIRKIVLDLSTRVIERTPVGDPSYWKSPPPPGYVGGHARANWSHSLGSLERKIYDEIDKDGSISTSRIFGSLMKGKAAGKDHYIQNSVPYIQRLEDGWSRQCPPNGMVGLTVLEYGAFFGKIVKEVQ